MRIDKNELTALLHRLAKYGNNFAFLMLTFVPWVLLAAGVAILLGKAAEALSLPSSLLAIFSG